MDTKSNHWFVILNPAGGNWAVRKRQPELLSAFRQSGMSFEVAFTERPGHAAELASEAIRAGYRKLVAIGGDGTGHEVVNGIMKQNTVDSNAIKFALLPVGTGNDWVKTWGVQTQLPAWMEMLRQEKTAYQDVGLVHYRREGQARTRYFFNVAGMAYDAFVAKYAEGRKHLLSSKFFYLGLVFICLFRYRLTRARIEYDSEILEDYFYTINVGICPYSGGGMRLVPHARPDDAWLALTLARRLSKLGVILNTWRFYDGSLGEHPKISLHSVKKIRVSALSETPLLLEADGEFLGEAPAEFSILPNALQIIIP